MHTLACTADRLRKDLLKIGAKEAVRLAVIKFGDDGLVAVSFGQIALVSVVKRLQAKERFLTHSETRQEWGEKGLSVLNPPTERVTTLTTTTTATVNNNSACCVIQ